MKKYLKYLLVLLFIGCGGGGSSDSSTDTINEETTLSLTLVKELAFEVSESSGLININGRLFTHNDSGDTARLYEISPSTGLVLRTIIINGADNIDWEDISSDDTNIYVGDFGNNLGNRSDLKIYKILKTDLLDQLIANAEIINFSYADQVNYAYSTNTTPYDAEALIVVQNNLYIFSKNWETQISKVYKLSTTPGTYTLTSIGEHYFDVLITGASYEANTNKISLIGYSNPTDSSIPFTSKLIILEDFTADDFFSAKIAQYPISNSLSTGQVESISFDTSIQFYITAEGSPAKLYTTTVN